MAEESCLLPVTTKAKVKSRRFLNDHFCIRSKAACLILLECFAVLLIFTSLDVSEAFKSQFSYQSPIVYAAGLSLITLLAPLAGLLADLKYARFRTVQCCSYFLFFETGLLLAIGIAIVVYMVFGNPDYRHIVYLVKYKWMVLKIISALFLLGITAANTLVFLISSIRFGIDQLQDKPTEDTILFVNWYVWLYYLAYFFTGISYNLTNYDYHNWDKRITYTGIAMALLLAAILLFLLALFTCVVKFKSRLFLVEPPGVNPYKLVYGVTKFAYQHKVPLRRSAFTYCEDELPSRMDLGKQKYGGPFTTREVEDVKAFWGIFKVVSSLGPAYMLQLAAQAVLSLFSVHGNIFINEFTDGNVTVKQEFHLEGMARYLIFSCDLLSPFLVVISIPLYLCFIRRQVPYQMPGMLKRIGLGIALIILSLVLSLAMDVAVHAINTDTQCMLSGFTHTNRTGYIVHINGNITTSPLYQSTYFFTAQHILSAITNMLIDIAALEFILSQSPYSMKGLFLGYLLSIKGLFQTMAIALIFPFGRAWNIQSLSCGSGFYLSNIVLGLLELTLFVIMAKRYKYRTVNEPCNEYRYAEDYYSNIQ